MAALRSLERLSQSLTDGPLMVHSDVFKASRFVPEYCGKEAYLESHWQVLSGMAAGRPIWMPAFHYGFPKTGYFHVDKSPSQVGALTEFFRKRHAQWRTAVPVFSFAGLGQQPRLDAGLPIRPFGRQSIFADLLAKNGTLLFYGAPFVAITYLHYVEHIDGGPVYRYDKRFAGRVERGDGAGEQVVVEFHVRPAGRRLIYDVQGMLQELRREGIARFLDHDDPAVIAVPARPLTQFWLDKLSKDPFFMLTDQTKAWVIPEYERLGRGFELADFEPDSGPVGKSRERPFPRTAA